jgi:MoaA/NifB/PqqE/SkfB family radical SAM enzyme
MNSLTKPKINTEEIKNSGPKAVEISANGNGNPAISLLKKWLKKMPFAMALDFYRRRFLDSPTFDSTIEPMANILEDWPRVLVIDNTNSCNAKCVWCPNPDLTNLGVMKMDVFRHIMDDYSSRGGHIRFGTFGEPMLDKTLGEKIEYLRRFSSITGAEVLTNGYFLTEKITSILLDNSIGVEVSLDELDKETFEDVKKMSYDVVKDNILAFLEANDKAPKPVPVNFRVKTLKTYEETVNHELYKRMSDHNCSIELTPIDDNIIANWAGKFDKDSFFENYLGGTPSSTKFSYKQFNLTNKAPCVQLWKWLVIYWDASAVLCCVDMFSTTRLGNLKDKSIKEIWTGSVMSKMREKMRDRKRFDIPICQDCDIHLSWHNLKEYYDKSGKILPNRRFIS